MSCQKEIAKKIQEGGTDYVLDLKGNQPALLESTALYFEHYAKELPCKITIEKDYGHTERREIPPAD